jgi:hypothetical protein
VATAYSPTTADRERGPSGFQGTETVTSAATLETNRIGRAIVLAQIPDVSPKSHIAGPGSSSKIRFDPPQHRSDWPTHHKTFERTRPDDSQAGRKSTATGEIISRFAPTKPRALPAGDPFAIPSDRLQDRLKPVGQFLLLFVLFTAAGTSLLMIGRPGDKSSAATPTTATIETAIGVPTAGAESSDQVITSAPTIEQAAAPMSAGPASDWAHSMAPPAAGRSSATGATAVPPTPRADSVPAMARIDGNADAKLPASPPQPENTPPASATRPAAEAAPMPYPATNYPAATFPETIEQQLPQVRTTDPQPAIARLRGDIRATSTR